MSASRHERIRSLEPEIRRIASTRLSDPHQVDEVVQETLTRLFEAQHRLAPRTLASYAVVTARNLITSMERARSLERKHAPGLIDATAPDDPQEVTVRTEEHRALLAALESLTPAERSALVDRDLHEIPTADIADRHDTTPGAAATRIARARARTRVEFLLAYRRAHLPTRKCRPVLYSIAAGDQRRQTELDAAQHVDECGPCRELIKPLVSKSRRLATTPDLG